MASKRKKFRPTKITRDDDVLVNGYDDVEQEDLGEDPMEKIKKFIEEGSEDTPDDCHERLKWSPMKKALASDVEGPLSNKSNGDSINSEGSSFPMIFTNGHVPANLKFHQLKKDEIESMEVPSPYAPLPVKSVQQNRIVFDTQKLKDDVFLGLSSQQRLSFKQGVPVVHKRSPSKRARPADDDTPRYSCTTCKYVTNRSDHYKRHLMTHSADKPLKCPKCSYGTGRSDHYKRHLQRHGLSEQEVIDTCFRNGLKLKNTTVSSSTTTTSDTNKTNESKENMQQSDQSNSDENTNGMVTEKKHKCEQCDYSTDKINHMTRHKKTHEKPTVTHCRKCNKSFKTPNYFSQHRCAEKIQRRCPKCDNIFIDKSALTRHINIAHKDCRDAIFAELAAKAKANKAAMKVSTNESKEISTCDNDDARVSEVTETAILDVVVLEAGGESEGEVISTDNPTSPMDLTCDNKDEVDLVEKPSDVILINDNSNDGQRTLFVPNVPSNTANLGCTKCGEWFAKFYEYSSHTCVP